MKHEKITKIEKWVTTWRGMWLIFFICTAALAAFVQLIVLPHFLPDMHYGHGLFVPDSTGFHQMAQDQAATMMKDGWKAWQLRPKNHYPAGIASIFYYLWYPEPFALIPFNAALHATAGCLIFLLLSSFIYNRIAAFSGAALFVLNPTSLEWTSQIHKDGTFILGNLLILSAWLLILKNIKTEKWQLLVNSAITFLVGTIMVWVSRPYWVSVVLVACAAIALVMFFRIITVWCQGVSIKTYHTAPALLGCIMLVMLIPFMGKDSYFVESFGTQKTIAHEPTAIQTISRTESIVIKGQFKGKVAIKGYASKVIIDEETAQQTAQQTDRETVPLLQDYIRGIIIIEGQYKGFFLPDKIEWRFSSFMPDYIESKLYGLSIARFGCTTTGGKSLIDPDIQLMSVKDYLLYIPRAFQVGFLSPFPSMWFTPGSTAGTTAGRTVLGIVSMFFYVCIAFFVWSFRIYWKNHDFWLVVLCSTYGLLVFTYAYPNVGTLNRFRYGFYMTIVSIGFAFAIQQLIVYRKTSATFLKEKISK